MQTIDAKSAYGYFTKKKRLAESNKEPFALSEYEAAIYCINKQIKQRISGNGGCPSCGKKILFKSNYCPNCGQRIGG